VTLSSSNIYVATSDITKVGTYYLQVTARIKNSTTTYATATEYFNLTLTCYCNTTITATAIDNQSYSIGDSTLSFDYSAFKVTPTYCGATFSYTAY
jgi:hypothetical protein